MKLLGLALLLVLLALGGVAAATTPVKGLGTQPAAESVPGPGADGIWRFYRAAPMQRTLARWIAVLAAGLLGGLVVFLVRDRLERNRRGDRPRYSYLVVLVAPALLLVFGLWIGWGQTRVDLERGTIEIRPLGVPLPARVYQLGEAERLVVASIPGVSSIRASATAVRLSGTFWQVRLEGPELDVALKVQIGSAAEATELATRLGEVLALPVQAPGPGP